MRGQALKYARSRAERETARFAFRLPLGGMEGAPRSDQGSPSPQYSEHGCPVCMSRNVVDGIGAFRTHAGSAHGGGSTPRIVQTREARLAVHAAHT